MTSTTRRLDRLAAALPSTAPPDDELEVRCAAVAGVSLERFRAEVATIRAIGAGGVPFSPERLVADVARHHAIDVGSLTAEMERVAAEVGR